MVRVALIANLLLILTKEKIHCLDDQSTATNIANETILQQQLKQGSAAHMLLNSNQYHFNNWTFFSVKQEQRISIPSHPTYNPHQLRPHMTESFGKNVNYNSSENTFATAYSHSRHSQYDNKFENFDFSANDMNVNRSNCYVAAEQREFRVSDHRMHESDENFDSFMDK